MNESIRKYLTKHADLDTRPLISGRHDGIAQVVVIPALAEHDTLLDTLTGLGRNPLTELDRTLVLCVVNNRAIPLAAQSDIEDNRRTLAMLDASRREGAVPKTATNLRIAYVDASSPGCELSEKGGVGLARKIGLDWGLALLAGQNGTHPRVLISLDADTHVEPNYLAAVRAHFQAQDAWAAVVAYAHRLEGSNDEVAAIICYELFLRYHVLGLRFARSPYAFPSIGSTMICTAQAYAAVSGMNRRQAGEDFYFLQQLAKTGRVDPIATTTVYPSARPSPRVPFGTGQRVRRFLEGGHDEYILYDPETYRVLRDWLTTAHRHARDDSGQLLALADEIAPPLRTFLETNAFARTWPRLQKNSARRDKTTGNRPHLSQFDGWFDGFKTFKLIHHLRDNGFPQRPMFECLATLLEWLGEPFPMDCKELRADIEGQKALLEHVRTREETSMRCVPPASCRLER